MQPSFYLYDSDGVFCRDCEALLASRGWARVAEPHLATVAIAPLLRRKLHPGEYAAPRLGTLVFHPSALPYRRGPDAVRHAVASGERVSAATWFWCDGGLDTGPLCEQEVVVLALGESAGRAYHTRFAPAGLRALARAADAIERGAPNKRVQEHAVATYDRAIIADA